MSYLAERQVFQNSCLSRSLSPSLPVSLSYSLSLQARDLIADAIRVTRRPPHVRQKFVARARGREGSRVFVSAHIKDKERAMTAIFSLCDDDVDDGVSSAAGMESLPPPTRPPTSSGKAGGRGIAMKRMKGSAAPAAAAQTAANGGGGERKRLRDAPSDPSLLPPSGPSPPLEAGQSSPLHDSVGCIRIIAVASASVTQVLVAARMQPHLIALVDDNIATDEHRCDSHYDVLVSSTLVGHRAARGRKPEGEVIGGGRQEDAAKKRAMTSPLCIRGRWVNSAGDRVVAGDGPLQREDGVSWLATSADVATASVVDEGDAQVGGGNLNARRRLAVATVALPGGAALEVYGVAGLPLGLRAGAFIKIADLADTILISETEDALSSYIATHRLERLDVFAAIGHGTAEHSSCSTPQRQGWLTAGEATAIRFGEATLLTSTQPRPSPQVGGRLRSLPSSGGPPPVGSHSPPSHRAEAADVCYLDGDDVVELFW